MVTQGEELVQSRPVFFSIPVTFSSELPRAGTGKLRRVQAFLLQGKAGAIVFFRSAGEVGVDEQQPSDGHAGACAPARSAMA